ncbi:SAM domain-containing protein [Durusdinium trenchii]|uniref:SAM domain-containing protein n=1 Tax=Durusdinium trenchii TaxID=1381693 RepID=A0ABP0N3F9_9DINO
MPVRRSQRIRPFVMAVVFLFHTELLSFCGMSNPRMSPADRRLKSALNLWFKGKPEETAEPEPRQDISTMDVGAVSHWLRTLSMGQYISTFEAAAVDGLLLANLTGQDLQDIGIDKGIHRKKILMHRDKLLVEGVKTLSVGDQLLLDREYSVVRGNDATPDPEVQRFAPTILKHMRKEGLDLQVPHEIFIKNVDSVDADLLEQSGILDTLEAINHYVWSHTATVDQDAGGVREEIQEEKALRGLEEQNDRLVEQKARYEQRKEKYRDMGVQQRNETRNIRDWHVKSWWRFWWKDEMEVYDNQVKKDEEQRMSDEQLLDQKLEEIENNLTDINVQKGKRQEHLVELRKKDSEKFWKNILNSQGLLSAEAEVEQKDASLKVLQDQLLEVMRATGVTNPEMATRLITQHERTKFLYSEVSAKSREVATNMQEWLSLAGSIIRDPTISIDALPMALLILHDEHQEQMRSLQKSRPQFLKRIWDSTTLALSPPALNATA